jgi:hypothetical protein
MKQNVILIKADVPNANRDVYPEEACRKMVEKDKRLWFDEKTKCVMTRIEIKK